MLLVVLQYFLPVTRRIDCLLTNRVSSGVASVWRAPRGGMNLEFEILHVGKIVSVPTKTLTGRGTDEGIAAVATTILLLTSINTNYCCYFYYCYCCCWCWCCRYYCYYYYCHFYYFFFFFSFSHTSTFQLLDKPWSRVASLLLPGSCVLSLIGFNNPTARRFFIECC